MMDHTEFLNLYMKKFESANKIVSTFFKNIIMGQNGRFYIVVDKLLSTEDDFKDFINEMCMLYLFTRITYVNKVDLILKNEQNYEYLDVIIAIIKEAFDYSCVITLHTTSNLIVKHINMINSCGYLFNAISVSVMSQYTIDYFNLLSPYIKVLVSTNANYYDLEVTDIANTNDTKQCDSSNLIWYDSKLYPCLLCTKLKDNFDFCISFKEFFTLIEANLDQPKQTQIKQGMDILGKLLYLRKCKVFKHCNTCKLCKGVV